MEWIKAQRRLRKAADAKAARVMEISKRKEDQLRQAAAERDRKLAQATRLKGEYDRELRDGQLREKNWLTGLMRSVGMYRQVNLSYRTDGKRPMSFDQNVGFELQLASLREKLDNHA